MGPGGRSATPLGPPQQNGPQTYTNPNPQPNANPTELPQGLFNPSDPLMKDFEVWAHDETTTPGHTYRYKLQVYLKNPLFAVPNLAKNPADEKKLDILAESEWTDKVLSPQRFYFFAANSGNAIGGADPKISFEIYAWQDGEWKKETKALRPGDAVGSSNWTLVDIRSVGNTAGDNRALLVADNGETATRFYKTDLSSKEYKDVLKLLTPAVPTGTIGSSPTGSLPPAGPSGVPTMRRNNAGASGS
jgi:hypothetical protein